MKKLILFICVMILALGGVAAPVRASAAKPKLDKKNPVTVSLWHYYIGEQKKSFDQLVDEFNNSFGRDNGIIVEAFSKSSIDILVKEVNASFNKEPGSEKLPDAFLTYSDSAYPIAKKGLITSYDSYVDAKVLSGYVDGFISEGRFLPDKKLYILPIAKSTEVICLNKTDFDKFLAANSKYNYSYFDKWEDIGEMSRAYYNWTASQGTAKPLFGLDSLANFIISTTKQHGADIIDPDKNTVNLPDKAVRAIWDTYYVNMVSGYFGAIGRFRSDDIKTGSLLSYLGSNTSGSYFPTLISPGDGKDYKIDLQTFKMPVYKNADKVAIQQGAGVALVKSTNVKEYAMTQFLVWATDPSRNSTFTLNSSYLPVTKQAITTLTKDDGKALGFITNTNIVNVLKVALDQTATYNMYLSKPFEKSYDVRTALQTVLNDYTTDARKKYQADIGGGASPSDAIKKYIDEKSYSEFKNLLNKALTAVGVSVEF